MIRLVSSLAIMGITSASFIQKIGFYVPAMLLSSVLYSIGAGLLPILEQSLDHSYWIGSL
jgi:hypothetical protein